MSNHWQKWAETVLNPLLYYTPGQETPELQQLLAQQEVDLVLLAGDTDRTQDYVFESVRLPEIRGGSELLRQLNEEGIPHIIQLAGLSKDCLLYAGGGGFLALVPNSVVDKLVDEIERLYPEQTGVATITCCARRVTPAEVLYGLYGTELSLERVKKLAAEPTYGSRLVRAYGLEPGQPLSAEIFEQKRGFGQLVRVMGYLLRQRKDNPMIRPVIETLPVAMRCRACRIRPAEQVYTYFEETWPLCRVCRRKTEASPRNSNPTDSTGDRSYQIDRFLTQVRKEWPDLWSRYLAGRLPHKVYHPQDLSELGAACETRPGYIGFIYADGNRIGKILESLMTPQDYRQFSQILQQAVETAAHRALAENLHPVLIDRVDSRGRPVGRVYIHPLEPLVIGGDDVMLLVPGEAALPIAARLCQLFEQALNPAKLAQSLQQLPAGLSQPTLAVGMVIADSHNPVRVLQQLAKELGDSAKSRAYDQPQATSAIDLLVLKSQSMLRRDVKQLRQMPPYYYEEGREQGRSLITAPYTLAEYCRLLKLLKLMRRIDFPTSQLQSLVAALARGRQYGTTHYMYQQARQQARLDQPDENFLTQLATLWPYDPLHDPIPWQRVPDRPGQFASVLPDLLEFYPLVPRLAGLSPQARQIALADLWEEIFAEVEDANSN